MDWRAAFAALRDHATEHRWREGIVYFIGAHDGNRVRAIKIGWTRRDVHGRLHDLQVGSPDRLILLGCMPGTRAYEERLHAELAASRLTGEWFAPTADVLDELELARAEPRPLSRPDEEFARARGDCGFCQQWEALTAV